MATKASMRQAKYDKDHCTMFCLKLNNRIDQDIMEKLAAVDSKQGYIKKLIREDLARTCSEPKRITDPDIEAKISVPDLPVPKTEKKEGKTMTYHIKPEYFDYWVGSEDHRSIDEITVTEDDIKELADEWETTEEELKKQLIPD